MCWLQVACHPWHELHPSGKTQPHWFRLFVDLGKGMMKWDVCYICTLMWFFPSFSHSLSFFGLTGTTTWWTVSGTESSPFRSTHVGKCMIFSESFFTSNECSVAEQTITYKTHVLHLWTTQMHIHGKQTSELWSPVVSCRLRSPEGSGCRPSWWSLCSQLREVHPEHIN